MIKMKMKLRTLRKIIQESISAVQKNKLESLFGDFNKESYHQAWELWNTLAPGTCPYPPPEEFYGSNGEPLAIELFEERITSQRDSEFFNVNVGVIWAEPKEDLSFEFDFPFMCDSYFEDAIDPYMEPDTYVVQGTSQTEIINYIEENLGKELGKVAGGTWWSNWKEIKVIEISDQDYISSMDTGYCTVLISYK